VSAGARSACATRTDSTLYCFGQNQFGQAGQGNTTDPQATPVPISTPAATGWASVSGGYQHHCALRTDRSLYCWGDGGSGRLGVGSTTLSTSPVQVPGSSWWALGLGTDHTCAIKLNGTLWCWGSGGNGRLGLNSTLDKTSPTQVGTLTTWRTVLGGMVHTCAVRADNTVWCWGANDKGQTGMGAGVGNLLVPTQLTGLSGRPAVAGPGSGAAGLITY
jgi:alpha-tubulin suppressor-like RCC1 family protein